MGRRFLFDLPDDASPLMKLEYEKEREILAATKPIITKYQKKYEELVSNCDHDYGDEYVKRDNLQGGLQSNLFNTPFIFSTCSVCGHESCRLSDDDNPEDHSIGFKK